MVATLNGKSQQASQTTIEQILALVSTSYSQFQEYTGTPHYVSSTGDDSDGLSWDTAYNTIQQAVDDCSPLDIVNVAGGTTYDEDTNLDGLTIGVNSIYVRCADEAAASIENTDATAAGAAVTITGNYVALEGFRINKGNTVANGVGLRFDGAVLSRAKNCVVTFPSDASNIGVEFIGTSIGSGLIGISNTKSIAFGLGLGTGVSFGANATRCFLAKTGIGLATLGVDFAATASFCALVEGALIQDCTNPYRLNAGASNNILSMEVLKSGAALDNSGNATNVTFGSPTALAEDVRHIDKTAGNIWFVNKSGADTNSGETPAQAFLTIGAAHTAASAGDTIKVAAGTYDAAGRDITKGSIHLDCESGVILADTTPGTCLVVSGASCRITGAHFVQAGGVGLQITGIGTIVENSVAVANTTGFDIDEHSTQMFNCVSAACTVTAYDIGERNTVLRDCFAPGTGASTRGFYLSAAAVTRSLIDNCHSVGNGTAGFEAVSGTSNNTISSCSSGGGDGRWVDADSANVWSGFTFDDEVYHTTTFDASGPTSDNLFRVYGTVLVTTFSGDIETVLSADIGDGYIELYDGTNTVDVTDSPGPDFDSLPVDTYIHKIDDNTVQIGIENSSQVRLYEDASKFGQDPNFQVTAKNGAASYIRFVYSDTGTSGAIHWHIQWQPLTELGFVEAV